MWKWITDEFGFTTYDARKAFIEACALVNLLIGIYFLACALAG